MLPSLSELFERLVPHHIHSSLEVEKLLSERNSGFRKKVLLIVIVFTDRFMDISKDFDRVIPSGLIYEFE